MGGNAFNSAGSNGQSSIAISRLSPAEYRQLKAHVRDVLHQFFQQVQSPAEAPEKADYGDLDFLVQTPLPSYRPDALESSLSAKAARTSGPVTNFAVPLQAEDSTHLLAQVDVHICHDGNIDWLTFHHAYGDIWQILGTIIRRYGLTANDKGLFVRIQEGEDRDWQKSMIFLTQDPQAVLAFLGLNWTTYDAGFTTLAATFHWLAQCRLLDPSAFKEAATEHRQRNIRTRPMFRRFIEDFIPTLPEPEPSSLPSRNDILHQALDTFNKQDEYDRKLTAILAENREIKATSLLVETLKPQGEEMSKNLSKNINLVVRAVKRWAYLSEEDKGLRLRAGPEMDVARQMKLRDLLDGEGGMDGRDRAWVKERFEELKGLEKQRVKEAKEARK
ncbi:hypothetical protein BDZ85DRAFT_173649, partial [Elsinoe ampelina]